MTFGIHARKFIAVVSYPTLKTYGKPIRYFCATAVGVGVIYCKTSNVNMAWKSSNDDFDVSKFMADPVTNLSYLKENKYDMKTKFELLILRIQADFCRAIKNEEEGGADFIVDRWKRNEGGGGISCVLEDGKVFEKAGVNVSIVKGVLPSSAVAQMKANGKKVEDGAVVTFFSASISAVVHPRNPHVPTIHFDYRYFETRTPDGKKEWWFGGITDLIPCYLYEEDARHFHGVLKKFCDKHDKEYYPRYKAWADRRLIISHRGECRGIGGIFFEHLDNPSPNRVLRFVTSCAEAVLPAYIPIVQKRKHSSYTDAQRDWQLLRRGRYAEFDLVYDRITHSGLHGPEAKHESILMALPPYAKWEYMHRPSANSEEEKMIIMLRQPIDWA